MKLYPLKFEPFLKSVIWGGSDICKFKGIESTEENIGESWEISGVKNHVSIVSNGDMAGKTLEDILVQQKELLLGKKVYETYGDTFPLLIKFIDARDDLSIQVHPDDVLAKERHNTFGKTEMWYVVKATPEAYLYSGFAKQITPDDYVSMVENGTFTDSLMKYNVKSGDVFFLPAGRVHAIGAGCFIAEIQQTSDITYRIYDFNRKDAQGNSRELHTQQAKDAIDFTVHETYKTNYSEKVNESTPLVSCPYFTTNLLEINQSILLDYKKLDSFVIYICMMGKAEIKDNKGNVTSIQQGETVLIPADTESVEIIPSENTKVLETFIE